MSIKGFITSLLQDILVLYMITQGKKVPFKPVHMLFAAVAPHSCLCSLLFEVQKKRGLNHMASLCSKKELTLKRCSIAKIWALFILLDMTIYCNRTRILLVIYSYYLSQMDSRLSGLQGEGTPFSKDCIKRLTKIKVKCTSRVKSKVCASFDIDF